MLLERCLFRISRKEDLNQKGLRPFAQFFNKADIRRKEDLNQKGLRPSIIFFLASSGQERRPQLEGIATHTFLRQLCISHRQERRPQLEGIATFAGALFVCCGSRRKEDLNQKGLRLNLLVANHGHLQVGKKTSIRRDCDWQYLIVNSHLKIVGKKTSIRRDCDLSKTKKS